MSIGTSTSPDEPDHCQETGRPSYASDRGEETAVRSIRRRDQRQGDAASGVAISSSSTPSGRDRFGSSGLPQAAASAPDLDADYVAWRRHQLAAYDEDYRVWRETQMRRHDEDYRRWRRAQDFEYPSDKE